MGSGRPRLLAGGRAWGVRSGHTRGTVAPGHSPRMVPAAGGRGTAGAVVQLETSWV